MYKFYYFFYQIIVYNRKIHSLTINKIVYLYLIIYKMIMKFKKFGLFEFLCFIYNTVENLAFIMGSSKNIYKLN